MNTNTNMSMNLSYHILEGLPEDRNLARLPDNVVSALRGLLDVISSIGYHELFERISKGLPLPSHQLGASGLASAGINVIPGTGSSACHPALIALSKGGGNKVGFDATMQRVRTHLTHCRGITKTVVFFCDSWSSSKFQKTHFEELKALYNKDKVSFVFLMVGNPDSMVTRVPVVFK